MTKPKNQRGGGGCYANRDIVTELCTNPNARLLTIFFKEVQFLKNFSLHSLIRKPSPGFTLAEVLITLGIIGVVAAMTLPTVITNYRKKQTVVQLKKAYSEINQAVRMAESIHGTLDSWDFSVSSFENSEEQSNYFAENYLFPNIKTIKRCSSLSDDCWVPGGILLSGEKTSSFITASGYAVNYWLHRVGNGAWFIIDTNASKAPNEYGIDRFAFVMSWGNAQTTSSVIGGNECTKKLGFLPPGLACNDREITRDDILNATDNLEGKNWACTKTATQRRYCSALIMLDNWEIKDDYPWK